MNIYKSDAQHLRKILYFRSPTCTWKNFQLCHILIWCLPLRICRENHEFILVLVEIYCPFNFCCMRIIIVIINSFNSSIYLKRQNQFEKICRIITSRRNKCTRTIWLSNWLRKKHFSCEIHLIFQQIHLSSKHSPTFSIFCSLSRRYDCSKPSK